MSESGFESDYLALRAANDLLREKGKAWIFDLFEELVRESGREILIARQDWEFTVDRSTMVGQRLGARFQGKTLTIEIGWPRLPEHGFVHDQGLARGRISLSLSPMLSARPAENLILKVTKANEPIWHSIEDGRMGAELTKARLSEHLNTMVTA